MRVREILEKNSRDFAEKPAIIHSRPESRSINGADDQGPLSIPPKSSGALIQGGSIFQDQPVSFSSLSQTVKRLSAGLQKLGIKKADAVAIYLPNSPDYIYSYLAIFSLGAVAVPLDFMLKADELLTCLEHSESKVLITTQKSRVDFELLKSKLPNLKIIFSLEEAMADAAVSSVEIQDDDPAIIFYTSGTTGKPKGVLWTYKHLDAAPKAMEYFVDLSPKDVKLCAIPFSHSGGLVYIQNCITYAITLVLMDRFNPIEFLKNVEKYKVTCFHMVPSMYYAILQVKEFESYDLSSLRWVDVFGAPSAPELLRRFNQYCPNAKLLNGYGLTETAAPNTVTPKDSNKIESVGKSAPWIKIKIFDEGDKEVAIGEIGEVVMQSWVVMKEYFKDPVATSEAIRNNWFYTGDLGRIDSEGYLYIVGRKKEMIKVSGEIVYAPEVEEVILKHPQVKEAAVIGVPDKMRGEQVLAFAVLKDGQGILPQDLRYFCQEHLAHFKVPHRVEVVASLPKTRTGKIDKQALKNTEEKS